MKLNVERPKLFQEKHIPNNTELIGLSKLVESLNIDAPVRRPACVSNQRTKESRTETADWIIFDNKYAVENTLEAHLTFAFRHENIDLLVLKRLLLAISEQDIIDIVKSTPTGTVARRLWYFFEFLTGKALKVPDLGKVAAIDLLDGEKYFVAQGEVSVRHRVRNNLLGTNEFCPIVRRTKLLDEYVSKNLSSRAHQILKTISPHLIARAASFLLLADTKASFAIEGEQLPANSKTRWLKAIQQAGNHTLSKDEINRLHQILTGNYRFMKPGFREDFVFLGARLDNEAVPEFIGARPEDLDSLIDGLVACDSKMNASSIDPVVQAAAIAFGFVYIHPYEDGNGRLHRCLIHQTLQHTKFSPPGLIFPVSSVMLKWIDAYRGVLQKHSGPLMDFIDWIPTLRGNVNVRNATADLYRYADYTDEAEFLYRCVEETIINDVPKQLDYLARYDRVIKEISQLIDMPDRKAEDFVMFVRQNKGKLAGKRRKSDFSMLDDNEVAKLESVVRDVFEGFEDVITIS